MAMKHRHAANDWIREIHDDICGATSGNVDGIQPRWIRDADTVFLVGKEMRLMDVHRVKLFCGIDNSPVAVGANLCSYPPLRIQSEFLFLYLEALFFLGECDYQIKRGVFTPPPPVQPYNYANPFSPATTY